MVSRAHRHSIEPLLNFIPPIVKIVNTTVNINEATPLRFLQLVIVKLIPETINITASRFRFVAATIEKIVNETMHILEPELATTPASQNWSTDVTFDQSWDTDEVNGQKFVFNNPWFPDKIRFRAKRLDAGTHDWVFTGKIYASPTGTTLDIKATSDGTIDPDSMTLDTYETNEFLFTGGNRPLLPAGTYAIGVHRGSGDVKQFRVLRTSNNPTDNTPFVSVVKDPESTGTWNEFSSNREIAVEMDYTDVTTEASVIAVLANQVLKLINTTINVNEFVERTPGFVKLIPETLHINDLAQRIVSSAKVINEDVNIDELVIDPVQALVRLIGETINIDTVTQRILGLSKQVPETINIDTFVRRIVGCVKFVNETVNITEIVINPVIDFVRIVNETQSILDSSLVSGVLTKIVGEIIDITENQIFSFRKVVNEQVHIADSFVVKFPLGLKRVINEGIIVIDESIVSKLKEGKNMIRKKVNTFIRQRKGRSRSKGY